MEKVISRVLNSCPENHLLPFMWVQDGLRAGIPAQVETIYRSGAKAFCVESRTHNTFGEEEWWGDMEVILQEAEKRNMKVWLLDDKHFPTGYANGLAEKKYPQYKKIHLTERHIDVMGPVKDAAVQLHPRFADDKLIGIYMYKRTGNQQDIAGEPIPLTHQLSGNCVYADIPEGCWRIFFYYETRRGCNPKRENYIHMIDEEAVKIQLEAVYEPHYQHFQKYFGNTFAGFFSDEPCLGNAYSGNSACDPGFNYMQIGYPGIALPWSKKLAERLDHAFGKSALPYLAGLWYPYAGISSDLRYQYMDEMTKLYRDSFCLQIGNWCHAHHVEYIGHIIEDMNAHARLGCSNGHYFRSLEGQDMSGMDIVLHQIIPEMGEYITSSVSSPGFSDPEFYHYSLAQMCTSLAQLNPRMKGRSLCEVFGAYGWAENISIMKWLVDHLLVRGINHLVPHAFTPVHPNPDCPPHFYAAGNNPQFEGFQHLMGSANKVCDLLDGAKSTAKTAILYHGDAEWANRENGMLMQKPAKILTDDHIAFEYLPMDYIRTAETKDGCITVNGLTFSCLLVPFAPYFPPPMAEVLTGLSKAGLPVYLVCDSNQESNMELPRVPLQDTAQLIRKMGLADLNMAPAFPLVRISRWQRGHAHIYILFNEGPKIAEQLRIQLPDRGDFLIADFLSDSIFREKTEDGSFCCTLTPYQSMVLIFDEDLPIFPPRPVWKQTEAPSLSWQVSLLESGADREFHPLCTMDTLRNISRIRPDFSGIIRYEADFSWEDSADIAVKLTAKGQSAHLWINDTDCGVRIADPYFFDISAAIRPGKNRIRIEIANTLVHRISDTFSPYLAIPPSGMTESLTFYKKTGA